jgi:DNA-directed RNA polymerase subunit RPC12/RpoP
MYEDNEPWPITCPDCKHEFTEQIVRLKNNTVVRCPLCKTRIEYRLEEFLGARGTRPL